MACVSRESILAAAHAVGTELSNEIAEELARDVGYRMKEIIQASIKLGTRELVTRSRKDAL